MYISEGEKRSLVNPDILWHEDCEKRSMSLNILAYGKDHLRDHVGRSFSRTSVYTDRADVVPTDNNPVIPFEQKEHHFV